MKDRMIRLALVASCLVAATGAAACGDDDDDAAACTTTGGAVTGAEDAHCGATVQPTDPADCDGGEGEGEGEGEEEAPVMFNAAGDDDDCKYHLQWTSTPVCQSADVTFSLVVASKVDGSAVTGADAEIEAFLSDTHPAPNSGAQTHEDTPGTYTIGPIRFDAPGQWTVRFHLFDECSEALETTPHGHGAFFVDVP